MKIPTVVVIPTRFQIGPLLDLSHTLLKDSYVDVILVLDNGHSTENHIKLLQMEQEAFDKFHVYKLPNRSIYQLWNWGWKYARGFAGKNKPVNIAFLNDDVEIKPYTIEVLAKNLRKHKDLGAIYPDYDWDVIWPVELDGFSKIRYTESTFGAGGMAGFCFMIKGEMEIPYVDETLRWWYGDDDLVKQIGLAGYKIARVVGLEVEHQPEGSSRYLDQAELLRIKDADRIYFNKKYGENRQLW